MDKTPVDKKSVQHTEIAKIDMQHAEIEKYELLQPYVHGRPWNDAQNIYSTKMLFGIIGHCSFELGCLLIEAKMNVPHGQWLPRLKECGIDRRTAAFYIHVANRLIDMPRLKSLKIGVSKLNEILKANDEDLDDFERGGDLLGKDEDELAAMSREEIKDLVRKKDRRLEQAKEQLGELQAEIEHLQKPISKETDQFFDELNEMRHVLFHNLERFKKAAMGNMQHEIGVYTVFNIILFHCTYGIRALEDESDFGRFFPGTVPGYDPLALELLNLQELSDEEARKITQFKNAKAEDIKIVGPRHDPEEKN